MEPAMAVSARAQRQLAMACSVRLERLHNNQLGKSIDRMPKIKTECLRVSAESTESTLPTASSLEMGFGECCFCETQGRHTSMISDRVLRGEGDNYLAMLLECYDIFLPTGDAGSALICARCVCRLRDALAFRQLVLRAQRLRVLQAANTVQVEVTHTAAEMDIDIKLELEDSESPEPPEPDPFKIPEPPDTSGSLEPTTTSKASIPILVKPDPDIDIFEHWFIKPGSNPDKQVPVFTRMEIFNIWITLDPKVHTHYDRTMIVYSKTRELLTVKNNIYLDLTHLFERVKFICSELKRFWRHSNYNKTTFLSNHHKWLYDTENISVLKYNDDTENNVSNITESEVQNKKTDVDRSNQKDIGPESILRRFGRHRFKVVKGDVILSTDNTCL